MKFDDVFIRIDDTFVVELYLVRAGFYSGFIRIHHYFLLYGLISGKF
jgi:hypothetical protein